MSLEELAERIRNLTVKELIELQRMLGYDGGEGMIGVREPRPEPPRSPGDEIAKRLREEES